MTTASRAARFALVGQLLWPAAVVRAQSTGDPPRSTPMSMSLDTLIAKLPGQPVALASLVRVALRDGFAAQLATADRQSAEGTALYEGRAIDPQLRLITDMAGASRFRGVAVGLNRETTLAVDGALPWGTVLSADYARVSARSTAALPGVSSPTRVSVNVSQPLLDGVNQRTVSWRAAQVERTAAGHALRRAREEIATDLELQYWRLAEAQAVEAVYGRSLELAREILSRNTELASRDLIATVDVLTVRSGVALRESFYTQARQSRYDQSDLLLFAAYGAKAAAMVASDSLPLMAVDSVTPLDETPALVEAVRRALENRADLRAARTVREATRLRAMQSRNAVLPNLSLDGGWSSAAGGVATGTQANASGSSWRVGLSMSAPVLNRGDRGLSLVARTQLEIDSLRVGSREAQITSDVRAAVRAITLGSQRWRSAANAASLAWEQLVAERRRLELGLGDSFRLLQTEENAVQAQLEAVRARYDLARASARFRLAIGQVMTAP